jgi:PAS domain S-box-containing protein
MVAHWDRDLRCQFANQAYEQWFRIPATAIIGRTLPDLLGPSLYAANEPYVLGALRGEEQVFERFVPDPHGGGRHSLAMYLPLHEEGRVVGFLAHVTDVTGLKSTEAALRSALGECEQARRLLGKSESALRQAQSLGKIGSWEWEIPGDIVIWSEALYAIFGLNPRQLPPSYAEQAKLYAPESWRRLTAAVERAVTHGEPYVLSLQYVHADGHSGWIESRGEAVRDESDTIVGLRGTGQDITHRIGEVAQPGRPGVPRHEAGLRFMAGGGEMGRRMRATDWSASGLGAANLWPASLKTVLGMLLNTQHPMFIFWGPELRCFYNDAYARSIGPEKNAMLASRGADAWPEIWQSIEPELQLVMSGRGSTWHENQLLPIQRHGRLEPVYWTYSYSPIHDDSFEMGVGGVVVLCTETTQQVLTQRHQEMLIELDAALLAESDPQRAISLTSVRLGSHLRTSRVGFGQVLPDERLIMLSTPFVDGVAPLEGAHALETFGAHHIASQRRGEPVVCADVALDPQCEPSPWAGIDTRSFVSVPYIRQQRLEATLFVNDRQPRAWSEREIALIQAVASRLGDALERMRQENRWRAIFAKAAMPMSLTRIDGSYAEVNPAFRTLLGYREDEFLQLDFMGITHPDDRAASEEGRRRLVAGEISGFRVEKRYRHRDGHFVWCDTAVSLFSRPDGMPEGFITQTNDITARKQVEQALALSTQRFEVALENSTIVVFNQDRELRYTWIYNPALGYQANEVLGRRDADLFEDPQDVEVITRIKRDVMRTGQSRRQQVRVRQHGLDRYYELSVECLRMPTGEIDGVTCAAIDITAAKLAEEALKATDREKDRFLATLAHELRNPLAAIGSAAALLNRAGTSVEQKARSVAIIQRQTHEMSRLLDDLLDVARASSGKIRLERIHLDVESVIRLGLETARPAIDAHGHTVSIDLPTEPMWVQGDSTRLSQVISNLLVNAAKFTPAGGAIVLHARQDDQFVAIRVRDNGIGIAPGNLQVIFGLFGQVGDSVERSRGGLGIGLALVKSLVEMHGGTVQALSAGLGQGSEFVVRLPMATSLQPTPASTHNKPQGATTGLRILVVDDNVDAAESMAAVLGLMGHETTVAHDGLAALDASTTTQWDVILLDLGLPGLNGFEVCREIRKLPGGQAVTIVALSGWGQENDIRESKEAGVNAHLVKPVDITTLERLLSELHQGGG